MGGLRIVHAIRSDGFSGVERHVLRLATAQAGAGDTVHVIGGHPDRMRAPLAEAGVGHTSAARTLEVLGALRGLRGHADVVNTHMSAADVAAVVALRWQRGRPAVVSTRHFASERGRVGPLRLDSLVAGTVDAELSISRAVAASIGRTSTVVHSGLDPREPSSLVRERVILVAQRLQPEKQTAVAVDAFARSGLAAAGWRLQVAGIGPEREALETMAHELGVGASAEFLGYRTDVPDLMDRAGILLASCPVEGLGLTVLEAMQSGLPVIAADAGGHVELLDGLDPRPLFTPDDAHAAADVLVKLAGDEDGRARLGAAERARQQADYTIDAQVRGTDAVYRGAIQKRRSRA
ncbi:Glycosyltransferase involved in cell wall bisynthesis [Microbacterium sp. cf046]|uniref:glycosyltransferase family 4 protein n=1 Tax=Microbacterium sp. cf046 TaxID=1761803 RepID=UPI0008E157A5|nr:glycosyltransferase family 4 protein [Microbacterium sp. cf046]SFR91001.1 Glycosyltransferase involved in cell wall bisynthesis [Microbacterium sp. cf046]